VTTLAQRLQRDWWRPRLTLLTALLTPLSALYALLAALPRLAYRFGLRRPQPLPVPVIVVGNLIVGGAGKTPTVIAIVQALRRAGRTPGVISRGYGRRDDAPQIVSPTSPAADVGDEPLLIHLRTGAPVAVARDRVAAARMLCEAHREIDVLVSDDGLQHHRLPRCAQVLVFDERGAGNRWQLPAGPLRQPLPRNVPRRSVVLYNAAAAATPLAGWTAARTLAGATALDAWWRGESPSIAALQALSGRNALAAAGMAHPQRFFAALAAAGVPTRPCPLPDHHPFETLPWAADTTDVIVTEKDAVKLQPQRAGATRVWVAALDFTLPPGFTDALLQLLPPRVDRS
jgi:tetraacyldisaccharide 4'-kinase